MSLFQTDYAKRRKTPPTAMQAGVICRALFEYVLNDAFTTATDKIEMGVLPAGAVLTSAVVMGVGVGAITADVGFMSGTPGDNDNARTVGTDLWDDVDVDDTETAMTLLAMTGISASNAHRAIGVHLSANETASASKKIVLAIEYHF